MFDAARAVLQQAITNQAFPAASIEVGDVTGPRWRESFGALSFDPSAIPVTDTTIFDLASLTKVISTTPLLMQQVERGTIGLDDPVGAHIAEWRSRERSGVTLRDLLSHSSGLPGYRELFRSHRRRIEFETAICSTPLEYAPRTGSIYSDLGFILLGFLLDAVAPDEIPLSTRFDTMLGQMGIVEDLQFNPPATWLRRTAPTERDAWRGRVIVGEVHDENAWALGGTAGHAGLFGTSAAVGAYARHLLQVLEGRTGAFTRASLHLFIAKRTDVPGSSRALGWDTMLPTSSCGSRMSPRAFGHTGYTGTSLWIDPDRGLYVVLLTNRVHPTRSNDAIKQVRPAFHDAVMEGI